MQLPKGEWTYKCAGEHARTRTHTHPHTPTIKGAEGNLEIIDTFIALNVVVISWVYAYLQIYQVAYIKY